LLTTAEERDDQGTVYLDRKHDEGGRTRTLKELGNRPFPGETRLRYKGPMERRGG